MGRKPTPQPLALDTNAPDDDPPAAAEMASPAVASPVDARSPRSQRPLPFPISKFSVHRTNLSQTSSRPAVILQPAPEDASQQQPRPQPARDDTEVSYASSTVSSAIDLPSNGLQPQGLRQAVTESAKSTKNSFFQFHKGSKSANHSQNTQAHQHSESRSQILSRGSEGAETSRHRDLSHTDDSVQRPFPSFPSRSDLSLSSVGDADSISASTSSRKNKSKSFALLSRTKSHREKDTSAPKASPMPLSTTPSNPAVHDNSTTLRAAPAAQEQTLRDAMSSAVRNKSEDRTTAASKDGQRDKDHKVNLPSLRDVGPAAFLNGLRNSSTKAADLISKGLFGKSSRTGSTTDKEPVVDDEHYVLKVINLPLVEQTRLTRISKRLEDSRDKTEFWMPAFPWRAIDYLNYKGCEVEGLYRVPGSGPQIKKWQRKFDEQYDVNLFEQTDLYDINIVGSMLKAWLRQLPDELFPKEAQERISRECSGAEKVPPMLIDELSNLSPFNYYLLFAITCHLSLLLAHSDKNKMDFRNLCICFQPCMKIDAFCFKFLVCDWRDCWKGCKSEAKYIEEEYRFFDQPPPRGLSDMQVPAPAETKEDPPPSSRDSSKPSILDQDEQKGRLNKHNLQLSKSNASISSKGSSISTDLSVASEEEEEENNASGIAGLTPAPTRSRDLRPLSPIQPLSPLGF